MSDSTESPDVALQKLEDRAEKAEENWAREEKLRKELEALNTKLLDEKTNLLKNLEGEKGSLQSITERAAKLQAQKSDLESQLAVSVSSFSLFSTSFFPFPMLHFYSFQCSF